MVTRKPTSGAPAPPPTTAQDSQDYAAQEPPNGPWTGDPSESVWESVPPIHVTAPDSSGADRLGQVPATLRPGNGGLGETEEEEEEDNVWDEARHQSADADIADTNPFRRKPVSPQGDHEAQTTAAPIAELPAESFSRLDISEHRSSPWDEPTNTQDERPVQPHLQYPQNEHDPWTEAGHTQMSADSILKPLPLIPSPGTISLPTGEEIMWDDGPGAQGDRVSVTPEGTVPDGLLDDQNVWDDTGGMGKGKGKAQETPTGPSGQLDDWNLIDVEPSEKPSSPPNQLEEETRWAPTRQPVDGTAETYQIKNIRWYDPDHGDNPRTSPILVQNENGPCPLVALVNALTLTTPADVPDTTLVQVLRSREQVSLNLVLDAVFDELMSPRRSDLDIALPDVGDLYAFLQSLHTGMNVNPRFVPTAAVVEAYKRSSLTHLHPLERDNLLPGTFENTQEMALYATFSIPLIHGWLPSKSEPVYTALERQAASYEDVQNLLFREEELEDRLMRPDMELSDSEQQLYQDILTIKSFLNSSATQLTSWGIEVIGRAIRPGTFAILFRNDHFSTLYCHPQSKQLLTLVTDAGYRTHDEVVWETLVDVSGENSEFLSGDYRVVGGSGSMSGPTNLGATQLSADHGGEWTTVQNKRGKSREQEPDTQGTAMSSHHEQEDRDLALALQLQEEEDAQHREREANRQQQTRLSEQFIEQQGHHRPTPVNRNQRADSRANADLVPGRRSSNVVNVPVTSTPSPAAASRLDQTARPLVPTRRQGVSRPAEDEGDEAPPSYEQAASDQAYQPPVGHPHHAGSPQAMSRQSTRTGGSMSTYSGQTGPSTGRVQTGRRPVGGTALAAGNPQNRDKDCVVM